ncbi:DMT family transporter [Microlunatus speluncae]|uniref:DMT family transporter n=1 Tax=Microlunatus speluncae TaxID=2594267 RepID=UPI001375F328|nr:DMT family transporter [Microlunatus speluncae]
MTGTTQTLTATETRSAGRSRLTGSAAAALSLFLIGTSAPVASTIRDIPVVTGQATRYLIASAVLIAAMIISRRLPRIRPTRRDLLDLGLLGLFGIAGFNLFLVAASYQVAPALVGTVLAATPVLLAVVAPLLVRCRPSAQVLVGAVIVTVGTGITTGAGAASPTGILLCLGALGCELAFTLLAVRLIRRFGTFAATTGAAVSGAIVLTTGALIVDGPAAFVAVPQASQELLALLFLALAVSIGANAAWYVALPRLGAARSGLFYAFSPVGALAASLVLGAELPGPFGFVGLALVAAGLLVGVWQRRRPGAA